MVLENFFLAASLMVTGESVVCCVQQVNMKDCLCCCVKPAMHVHFVMYADIVLELVIALAAQAVWWCHASYYSECP